MKCICLCVAAASNPTAAATKARCWHCAVPGGPDPKHAFEHAACVGPRSPLSLARRLAFQQPLQHLPPRIGEVHDDRCACKFNSAQLRRAVRIYEIGSSNAGDGGPNSGRRDCALRDSTPLHAVLTRRFSHSSSALQKTDVCRPASGLAQVRVGHSYTPHALGEKNSNDAVSPIFRRTRSRCCDTVIGSST